MERRFPHLCSPITLGRTTFRNRMFSAPMGGTDIANDGCIGPKSTAFYELRAKGGAAAVTVSELMVHSSDGSHAYRLDESILNSLACATYTADAIRLGQEGKTVRLVEMRDVLAPDANVRHRPLLLAEIAKYVDVRTSHRALRVTKEGVVCADKEGNEVLVPGRSVICPLGQRSRSRVVDELRDTAPFVRIIGDAARVSTITNAVYWGYHAALDI